MPDQYAKDGTQIHKYLLFVLTVIDQYNQLYVLHSTHMHVFVTWTDLEILIKPHETGWSEGHGQEQGQWVPEPELGEDQHPHHPLHVHVTGAWLQRDRHVTAPWKREKRSSTYTVIYFNNLMKIAYVMIFRKHIINISIFNKYFMWEVNILWNSCVYYALLWQTLALASPINLCILETMFRSKSMKIDDNQNQWNTIICYI